MDNNFASIVNGIEQGRLLFENLRKAVAYLFPQGSGSELFAVLVNTFLGIPLPESTFLMIALCISTDVLGSVAMVFEPPEMDLMRRKPRNPKKHLIDLKILLFFL